MSYHSLSQFSIVYHYTGITFMIRVSKSTGVRTFLKLTLGSDGHRLCNFLLNWEEYPIGFSLGVCEKGKRLRRHSGIFRKEANILKIDDIYSFCNYLTCSQSDLKKGVLSFAPVFKGCLPSLSLSSFSLIEI